MAPASGQGLARRIRWSWVLFYGVTAIILLPFVWIALLSFKSNAQILGDPFNLSSPITLHNYGTVLSTLNILLLYKNTISIVIPSIVIEILI